MFAVPEHGPEPFSFAGVHRAYLDCRRGKGQSPARWRFEARLERNLIELTAALRSRSYQPASSVCFISDQPKRREIFAAPFRDRVVHHLLVGQIMPWWERRFIHDSYACRPGKGTAAAVDRVQQFLRQVTANGTRRAWTLHLDVRSFFVRIDKAILCRILEQAIRRQGLPWADDLAWLARCVVMRDTAADACRVGSGFAAVPDHKSLAATGNLTGLPIGNYSSQFFANVYLDGLDQFVKHALRHRHYVRYVDDLVLIDPSRQRLLELELAIESYLATHRALQLNERARSLRPAANGVDAFGYIIRHSHRLLRRRTARRFRRTLHEAQRDGLRGTSAHPRLHFPPDRAQRLLAQCMSYRGLLIRASSGRWMRSLEAQHGWVAQLWRLTWRGKVRRRLVARGAFPRLLDQWRAFKRLAGGHACVLLQVGAFWEAYGADADWLGQALGLRVAVRRKRMPRVCGFPVRMTPVVRRRLAALQDRDICWVAQQPGWQGAVRRRCVVMLQRYPASLVDAPGHWLQTGTEARRMRDNEGAGR